MRRELNPDGARELLDAAYRGAAEAESANAMACEAYGFDREALYLAVARCLIEFYGITQRQRAAYNANQTSSQAFFFSADKRCTQETT